jgi:CDK inhibitor PHO81
MLTHFTVPVLLCNDLGAPQAANGTTGDIVSSGKSSMSIKDAVRVAQSNNLMGLICRSQILDMVPALIKAIETAGLVLVSDASNSTGSSLESLPKGITGMLLQNGVMKFNEVTEM